MPINTSQEWLHTIDVPVFVTAGLKDWLTPPTQIKEAFEVLPKQPQQLVFLY